MNVHTGTVDAILVTTLVPVLDGFYWTTCGAMAQREVSHNVDTAAGAVTTVDTMKTPLLGATQVLLQLVCTT